MVQTPGFDDSNSDSNNDNGDDSTDDSNVIGTAPPPGPNENFGGGFAGGDNNEAADEPGGGTQDVDSDPEPSVDPSTGQADDPDPVPDSESSTVVFEDEATNDSGQAVPGDVKGVVRDDATEQRVQDFAERQVKREEQLSQANISTLETESGVGRVPGMSREPASIQRARQTSQDIMSVRSRNRQQLRPGNTNPDAPENTFGTPISDVVRESTATTGVTTPFDLFGRGVEPVEEEVSDFFGELTQDVRQVQRGKPATTTQEEVLETLDDATRAEGLQGEQSGLDIVESLVEAGRDISQYPGAAIDLASEGETDAFEQSAPFRPDERPVATLGRLAVEEAAFEGGFRLAAAASDAGRAGRRVQDAVSSPDQSGSPFDQDNVFVDQRSGTGQSRLTGETTEGAGRVETAGEDEILDVRLQDRETGQTLPVDRNSGLGERIVSENPERFAEVRRTRSRPGRPEGERLAEELVGRGDEAEDVDVRDILGRVEDDPAARSGGQESQSGEVQTSLTDASTQTVDAAPSGVSQEVEQATFTFLDEDSGRLRQVDEEQALDLLQDDDFRLTGRQRTPRERQRIRDAERELRQRGLDLPGDVSRGSDETQLPLGVDVSDTSASQTSDGVGFGDLFDLNRRGQARATTSVQDEITDVIDDGFGRVFRDEVDEFSEVRRGDDLQPEARSLDEFVEDDAFGARPPTPRSAPLTGFLQGQQGLQGVQRGQRGLSDAGLEQGLDVVQDVDTGNVFRVDEALEQGVRQTTDTTRGGDEGRGDVLRPRRTPRDEGSGRPRRPSPPAGRPPRTPGLGGGDDVLGESFTALVKEDGRFTPVGRFDDKQSAIRRAESLVDGSAARSFKVEQGGEPVRFDEPSGFRDAAGSEFVAVERSSQAIDTPGEKQDITVQGLLAQQNRRERRQGDSESDFEFDFGL